MNFPKIFKQIRYYSKDENFLQIIKNIEGLVSKLLSIVMLVVIASSLCDLIIYLWKELVTPQPTDLILKDKLFVIFGLFLNVLIALEILENITAYLKKHVVQVELVIITSLIAVARKIIILDLEKKDALDLIGLAVAIFALSISYLIIRRTTKHQEE